MVTNKMEMLGLIFVSVFAVEVVGGLGCHPQDCGEFSSSSSSSRVQEYCSNVGLEMIGRCCRDGKNNKTVGLDLRNCSLRDTSVLKTIGVPGDVIILDLTENLMLQKEDENDFDGYTSLDKLFFDQNLNISCPGGANSWNATEGNNETLSCLGHLDACKGFTCPNPVGSVYSHCESRGPGLQNLYCVCNSGYHGYKCMRHGEFPKIAFGAGLAGATAGLSAFLWITNRRLVK